MEDEILAFGDAERGVVDRGHVVRESLLRAPVGEIRSGEDGDDDVVGADRFSHGEDGPRGVGGGGEPVVRHVRDEHADRTRRNLDSAELEFDRDGGAGGQSESQGGGEEGREACFHENGPVKVRGR